MSQHETMVADRQTFYVVASLCVERAYPADPLSVARERLEWSVHNDTDSALEALFAELSANLWPQAALCLRQSWMHEVDVPRTMLGHGCPQRWLHDRPGMLMHGSGLARNDLAGLVHGPGSRLQDHLCRVLQQQLCSLRSALEPGARTGLEHMWGGSTALALVCAGAAARAGANAAIDTALAHQLVESARDVGACLWEAQDTTPLMEVLKGLHEQLAQAGATSTQAQDSNDSGGCP